MYTYMEPFKEVLPTSSVGELPQSSEQDGWSPQVPNCRVLKVSALKTVSMVLRHTSPIGSKYPTFKDSGPRNHLGHGFWNQRLLILGTWTLRAFVIWFLGPNSILAV